MATSQNFPTYKIHSWSSSSQKSSIIVQCSNNTTIDDPRTELPSSYVWETSATVSDGNLSLSRSFYFTLKNGVTVRPREVPPCEVFRAEGFPKKFARLPEDRRFIYLGNGELSKLNGDIDSAIWVYKAEYIYNPNIDDDEDENTKPWDRAPWNVSFSHPEVEKPFRYAYDSENRRFKTVEHDAYYGEIQVPTNPVVNSAGDIIEASSTKTNLQLNFTYAVRPSRFNINDVMDCIHTINKSKFKVIGIEVPAGRGFMQELEPHYNVDDNGNEYWELNTAILLDRVGDGFARHLLDVGNRALWPRNGQWDVNAYGVIQVNSNFTLSTCPEAIYGWWSFTDYSKGQFAPTSTFQIGNSAMLNKAKWQFDHTAKLIIGQDFVYEKLEQVPLNSDGTVNKAAMNPHGSAHKHYRVLTFQEHPKRDWDSLNMPTRGVKW